MTVHIIFDKEIVLKADGSLPSKNDLQAFEAQHLIQDTYHDSVFDITAVLITSVENLPQGFIHKMLRDYFAEHGEEKGSLAFRAKALLEWRAAVKFCHTCGAKLTDHEKLTAKKCPECGNIIFPRISPCIIVVIHKGDKILLVNHTYRNQDIYACVAGFMEAGESAEQAVAREVLEETGLKIKNIVYRGSQSWPFPEQLMLGFTADWESGELKLQEEEIADAQWFDPDNCPASPKPGSIAYRLIHKLY